MNLAQAIRTVQFFSAEQKSDTNKQLDSFKGCKGFNNENIKDPSPLDEESFVLKGRIDTQSIQ